ncbi:coproporphyrinogen III oxidase [Cephaloticoccus capnophilus]|uniref:Coproporphyrinogen-III oxidase n=1 Tax=Cephaloticoccus capnophilus TaxID=1548208 RepID=A0A139SIE2_9BACT|nr:oxygen-independent coproporphyrinogen III oxidase [Cephaloticoccus capnophilus]KXU34348.1 coproporphyrinogen III oxidase [Cephaloticoccus capnophilus]
MIISPELLQRFDVVGPRYTSYPTADRFTPSFAEADYAAALREMGRGAKALARKLNRSSAAISVYVHIPFCEQLCYYCACTKILTRQHGKAAVYLDYLERELALNIAQCGTGLPVSQLHLGGGTPTFFSDEALSRLMAMLRQQFQLLDEGEYSIEVDPRTVSPERLAVLRAIGFNRLSFGVQDFDPEVQVAVHRVQPAEKVFELVEAARQLGFRGINVDLIYGLPKQSRASFARTLGQIQSLRPDRIALYAYAHLPARFKPQQRIASEDLPVGREKLAILANAINTLSAAGYVHIGMDHFALPDDGLAAAKRKGTLHRNFQGYSTQPDCDLLALGLSAIAKVGSCYAQNEKTLAEYYAAIDAGRLPTVRGLVLTEEDRLRRAVIMAIMCQGRVDLAAFERDWPGLDFPKTFSAELRALCDLAAQGLVTLKEESGTASGFTLTALGWFFVRAVAMQFDRYLQPGRASSGTQFSKII